MTDETVTSEMIEAGVKAAGKYWQRFSKEREMVEAIFAAMRNVARAESIRNCFREMHGGEPIIASEMIEAGVCAGREHWLADRASRKGEAKAIYLAMRALDHEYVRMREALQAARDTLTHVDVESGYCCCGSPTKGHGMSDGHSPVDSDQYAVQQTIGRIDEALGHSEPNWEPHLDYAGEPMRVGEFRDPPAQA